MICISLYWQIMILAVVMSIDSLVVGITYGLKRVKINFWAMLLIGGISALAIFSSGRLGTGLGGMIDVLWARRIGSVILMIMGLWMVLHSQDSEKIPGKTSQQNQEEKILLALKLRKMGIIIRILREPVTADFDRSGAIDSFEAIILGFALAIDGLVIGLGIGMVGVVNYLLPLAIGGMSILFMNIGLFLAGKISESISDRFRVIPGFILIFYGVIKFLS